MRKVLINTFAIAAIIAGAVSCKGEKKNETAATAAKEVAKTVATSKFMVNTDTSVITWSGFKPGEKHQGTLHLSSGVVTVGENISGSFTIDMNSLAVTDLKPGEGKESLEGHLKGAAKEKEDHFFNVSKFPTAAFEVTGVSEVAGKKIMEGNLTIRGIKKNIAFPVSYSVQGNAMELNTAPFTINRTDWGVNYGSKSIFNNLGDKFIMDDIELKISLKATKAQKLPV